MIELDDIPEPVQWYEGMLLAPQHFQQAWRRSEALLGYGLMQSSPFAWGVQRLSIDRAMLASGRIRVLALEGILPDGLAVLHPREDEPYLERDITPFKDQMAKAPMAVHIAIPIDTPRPEPGDAKRWRSVEGASIADANTDDNRMIVARLRPALSLEITETPTTPPSRRLVSMPIARIGFRGDAFVQEPYAPPRQDFPAGSELATLCRSVVEWLREKALSIADLLRDRPERPPGVMTNTLRSIVGSLPRLEGLLQAERVPPFQVYLTLCDLMGGLSWLTAQPVPPAPPQYRHDDALPAFAVLSEYILKAIEQVREGYRALRFTPMGEGRFTLALADGTLPPTLVVGVRAPQTAAPDGVAEWLSLAQIGSHAMMEDIEERRIRGTIRQRIETAEELGLTPQTGLTLFRLTVDPDFIVAGQPLEIAGTGAGIEPTEIFLYAAQTPGGKMPGIQKPQGLPE